MARLLFNIISIHEYWMYYALYLAQCACNQGEVPIGAVLIYNNKIVGEGWNSCITCHDPTAHAEILALRQGGLTLQNYRLLGSTLYVTLEPCIMCLGAIMHSRISTLVYGAKDTKKKISTSSINILKHVYAHHKMTVIDDILSPICSSLLRNFFHKCRS